jgi:adenylate kinase
MRYLIMGPQGVGKGTQAALLAAHYEIPTISTGDIFRFNLKNKTALGLEASAYMEKGELVPDELTNRIVEDRLQHDDAKNGWILDGFPRNMAQVEALDAIMENSGMTIDAVIALDADRDVLLERMQKRAQIEGRADDTPEAIAERLSIYDRETKPLLDVYRDRGLLVEVNGVGEIDDITIAIINALDAR